MIPIHEQILLPFESVLSHIATTEPECIDRIRWEVEAKNITGPGVVWWQYPSNFLMLSMGNYASPIYNSQGKEIARFRVKNKTLAT